MAHISNHMKQTYYALIKIFESVYNFKIIYMLVNGKDSETKE